MDWYVLLTPLLALGVIALLGFTGCDQLFGLDELDPVAATTALTFEVRFPADLTVIEARFEWTRPGAVNGENTTTPVVTTDGTDTILTHTIPATEGGMWTMVRCHLRVQDTVEKGDTENLDGSFVLDPPVDPVVTVRFHTTGRPNSKDFRVVFDGRV